MAVVNAACTCIAQELHTTWINAKYITKVSPKAKWSCKLKKTCLSTDSQAVGVD